MLLSLGYVCSTAEWLYVNQNEKNGKTKKSNQKPMLTPRLLCTRAVLDCGHTPPSTTTLNNAMNAPCATLSAMSRLQAVTDLICTIRWTPNSKTQL